MAVAMGAQGASESGGFVAGLVSVTFRQLSADEIVGRTRDAGLGCIEWGGDIHVPHGELSTAERVRALTEDAGLALGSYGSYFRAGADAAETPSAREVVETAAALGAPSIRIWAGATASRSSDGETRRRVAADIRLIADLAAGANIDIVLEFHANTLTDDVASTLELLGDVDHERVSSGWQPPNHLGVVGRLASLAGVLPSVTDVHVFNWPTTVGDIERRPLGEARDAWRLYFAALKETGRQHRTLLEFVPEDDPGRLDAEAATLLSLIDDAGAR